MKKTIIKPINDQYSATVEFDGEALLVWIEKKCKFLWVFNSSERVSDVVMFYLCGKDGYGGTYTGVFAGRVMSLAQNRKNMATFNLNKEIYIYCINHI